MEQGVAMKFRGERYHGHKNWFCSTGPTLHVFLWWTSGARPYSCCCLLLQYANGHFSSIIVDLSALGRKGDNFCIVLWTSKATSEFYLLLNACRITSEHESIFTKNQACDSDDVINKILKQIFCLQSFAKPIDRISHLFRHPSIKHKHTWNQSYGRLLV